MPGQLMYLCEAPSASEVRMFDGEPDVLSVSQVASLLGVVPATVRREIARGSLESIHVGACVRVTKAALLRYVGEADGDD